MKKLFFFQKLIITTAFIILVIVITVNVTKKSEDKNVAQAVLNQTYGITLEDRKNLTNATQGAEDDTILLKYLDSVYKGQMTDNGYSSIMKNRVPTRVINTTSEENSDLKVTSIQLESRDAIQGSKCYAFSVKVETVKDTTRTFTFKGNIVLIRENGHWKVNDITQK